MKTLSLIPGNPNYTFSDELGEEKFLFRIRWDKEVQTVFLDMTGLTNDFSISGKALTPGTNILYPYRTGYGVLFLAGDEYGLPTLETLGDTYQLVWMSEDEAAAVS